MARAATGSAILVVDDDPVTGHALAQSLDAAGYPVTLATSAAEAVQRIDEVAPRLILVDLGLPEMSAFQLMQHLRSMPMWRGVPIMAVASIQRIEDVQRAIRLGASDFITRPINGQGLVDRVQRRIGRPA